MVLGQTWQALLGESKRYLTVGLVNSLEKAEKHNYDVTTHRGIHLDRVQYVGLGYRQ